ncbi:MAG: SRPBCC family protein [Myxococcota bacterium]
MTNHIFSTSRALFFALLPVSLLASGCSDSGDVDPVVAQAESIDPDQETAYITEVGLDHHTIYTDIAIAASPDEVWAVLTDFDQMPNWSSTLQGIDGELADGAMVIVNFDLMGTLLEVPHTLIYEPEEMMFGWADPVQGFEGIVDDHAYTVARTDGELTLFVQTDAFVGTDDSVTTASLAQQLLPLYEAFNRELKAEVERRSAR